MTPMFDCLAHERRKPVIADKVVISLASAERRNTTVPKLVDAGFRVLDAIDGRLMSKEEIAERFDTALFEDTFLHYPKPGEIGCTLSHLIAISDFAAAAGGADDWIVITEDDAALSPWWGRDLPRVGCGATSRRRSGGTRHVHRTHGPAGEGLLQPSPPAGYRGEACLGVVDGDTDARRPRGECHRSPVRVGLCGVRDDEKCRANDCRV